MLPLKSGWWWRRPLLLWGPELASAFLTWPRPAPFPSISALRALTLFHRLCVADRSFLTLLDYCLAASNSKPLWDAISSGHLVRKTLYVCINEIFQKWSHLSFCHSADIPVFNFPETPSVQPLITLASDLYAARRQSLIFWTTENPGKTQGRSPSCPAGRSEVREPSRAQAARQTRLGFWTGSRDPGGLGMCFWQISCESSAPHRRPPPCLWGGRWTSLFPSCSSEPLVRTLRAAAVSFLSNARCLQVGPMWRQRWGNLPTTASGLSALGGQTVLGLGDCSAHCGMSNSIPGCREHPQLWTKTVPQTCPVSPGGGGHNRLRLEACRVAERVTGQAQDTSWYSDIRLTVSWPSDLGWVSQSP